MRKGKIRKNRAIYGILFLFLLFSGVRIFEEYLKRAIPLFLSRAGGGKLSFSSMKIRYISQGIEFRDLTYTMEREDMRVSLNLKRCFIGFKRIVSEIRSPFRKIEMHEGDIKISLRGGGEREGFSIPAFLKGAYLYLEGIHFIYEEKGGLIKGDIKALKTEKIGKELEGSLEVEFEDVVMGSRVLPIKSLSTNFNISGYGIALREASIDSGFGRFFFNPFKWERGKGIKLIFKGMDLEYEGIRAAYINFNGFYDLQKKRIAGEFFVKRGEYGKFSIEEGSGEIMYSVPEKNLEIKNGAVRYGEGLVKVEKATVRRWREMVAKMELEGVPFERVLMDNGKIGSRVFAEYTGKVSLGGSMKPLNINGVGKLEVSNFSVCSEIYPVSCRKKIINAGKALLDLRFELLPYGVNFKDVSVRLPEGFVTGEGTLFFDESLDLRLKVHSLELRHLSPVASIPMKGMINGEVYITGPFRDISIYSRGGISGYGIGPLRFDNGGYLIFYRGEKLFYSASVRAGETGGITAEGLIDFSEEPAVYHISSMDGIRTEDLLKILGIPSPVKDEVEKIEGLWDGTLFMIGSISDGLPGISGRLESSSSVTYRGEMIDSFSGEGYFSEGEMRFQGYALKGGNIYFHGGYEGGVIYAEVTGNDVRIDGFRKLFTSPEAGISAYGPLVSPSLVFRLASGERGVCGELDGGISSFALLAGRSLFIYEDGKNEDRLIGSLVRMDPVPFFWEGVNNITSGLNLHFNLSLSEGALKGDLKAADSFIRVSDEIFHLKEPVTIKDMRGEMVFLSEDGSLKLHLAGDKGELDFKFPVRIIGDVFETTGITKGIAEGRLSFPFSTEIREKVKGKIAFQNLTVKTPFVPLEKLWGEIEGEGWNWRISLHSTLPPEIELEGTYSMEEGAFTGYLKARGVRVGYEGARIEMNSSLRGTLHDGRISLSGDVEVIRAFLPFDLSLLKRIKPSESSLEIDIERLKMRLSDVKIKGGGNDLAGNGELFISGSAPPSVSGRFTLEGRVEYMGKEFEIIKGELLWEGGSLSPYVDLLARTTAEKASLRPDEVTLQYEIYLSVKGFSDSPVVELRSVPSLSREDIFAVLFTGKTLEDISRNPVKGEGATARIYEAGLEAVLGSELSVLRDVSKLDKFVIYPRYSETLHRTTTFITLGKRVGRDFWVEYSRDLNYDEQRFGFMWRPARVFSVRSGWENLNTERRLGGSELGNISLDFIFQHEF